MKQGVNPTAAQKRWLSSDGYDPKEWLVLNWGIASATIEHKVTKERRTLTFLE